MERSLPNVGQVFQCFAAMGADSGGGEVAFALLPCAISGVTCTFF